ncbi:MAG: hypothetical protein OEQ39_00950 [Gammaproteobacteria bacterium]|nr:hypothetical protein [Gammaproteobacteria bacterium]MDH3467456.1 hypothetical protein [Gammaproteobacteria bacterium]
MCNRARSLPMGIGDEGLPLSLQIMGPPGHDTEVLRIAQQIEKLINWQQPKFYDDPGNSLQVDKDNFHAAAM